MSVPKGAPWKLIATTVMPTPTKVVDKASAEASGVNHPNRGLVLASISNGEVGKAHQVVVLDNLGRD